MHFDKAHEYELCGNWRAAIEEVVRLGTAHPSLWSVALMEVARLLRTHAARPGGLLFSARGLAPESADWLHQQNWSLPDGIFLGGNEEPTDVVHDAHVKEKECTPDEAIAWASTRAKGAEISALSLMLARRHVRDESLWLAFFNAYLAPHDLSIQLTTTPGSTRFARLRSAKEPVFIPEGPLVSVLMPVHEAETTLREAAASILNQSWRPLELIMVDDASQDDSWAVCREIARSDSRVRIHRNPVNVGPYVSKNVAMQIAQGQYLTCHDSDDWAFPERIAHQMSLLLQPGATHRATSGRMLRLGPDGDPTRPSRIGPSSEDGFVRPCFVSLMVERTHFERHLGAWDNIRFAADSELMERAMRTPGGVVDDPRILMLCLDLEGGLTRHPTFGLGSSQRLRPRYLRAWRRAHALQPQRLCYPFLPAARLYEAPDELVVPRLSLEAVFVAVGMDLSKAPTPSAPSLPLLEEPVTPSLHKHNALHEFAATEARIGTEPAIEAAERSLIRDLRYAANVLNANAALARGDTSAWLAYLNKYLQRFALAPIRLTTPVAPWEQWGTAPLTAAAKGGLVSVLLPVKSFDAPTLLSIDAVLRQTWRDLELLVVHEGENREGLEAFQRRLKADVRVRLLCVPAGSGAGVCLNAACKASAGEWIVPHDIGTWMHPQRIERQMATLSPASPEILASICHFLPVDSRGFIGPFDPVGPATFDGVSRRTHSGLFVRRATFLDKLGAWDCVQQGAEEELLARLLLCLGKAVSTQRVLGGFKFACEIAPTDSGLTDAYRQAWQQWHASGAAALKPLEFPATTRPFSIPEAAHIQFAVQTAAGEVANRQKSR